MQTAGGQLIGQKGVKIAVIFMRTLKMVAVVISSGWDGEKRGRGTTASPWSIAKGNGHGALQLS